MPYEAAILADLSISAVAIHQAVVTENTTLFELPHVVAGRLDQR